MPSVWDYFVAKASKEWRVATTEPIPTTKTPLRDLTQRSAVVISTIPLTLAQGNGSLIRSIAERNTVYMIGTMRYFGHTAYRAYLSGTPGAFLQVTVEDKAPGTVVESRIYTPYHELPDPDPASLYHGVMYADVASSQAAGKPDDLAWPTWLLDDPNPQLGGLIGCPQISGKMTDVDPATGSYYIYNRAWLPSAVRIEPVSTVETQLDANGETTRISHLMMQYARQLKDGQSFEHMLISATELNPGMANAQSGVTYWIGMDADLTDITVYAAPPAAV